MATAPTAPRLRKALVAKSPSLAVERELWEQGHEVVVGMDEVGRGAWAGPLTVGAAVVPTDRRVYTIRDSTRLTEAEREALFDRIAGPGRLLGSQGGHHRSRRRVLASSRAAPAIHDQATAARTEWTPIRSGADDPVETDTSIGGARKDCHA